MARYILHSPGLASCRRRPLSSNVRPHKMQSWLPLVNLFVGVPIAILTAWLTVRFALRRFQSEKWFERRLDAYTKVIECLHHMKATTEPQMLAESRGYDLPKAREEELNSTYRAHLAQLRRLIDMGSLLFSEDAVKALDKLDNGLTASSQQATWWEHMDVALAAISTALTELRAIAKRDLKA